MKVYIVVRRGVHDQGTVAVCDGLAAAKTAAEFFAEKEHDLYHDFELRTQSNLNAFFSQVRWTFRSDDGNGPREWMKIA